MRDSLITSKTRLRLLVKFFINAANRGHMRGLADEFNESTNAIRRELANLSDAGYLEKEAQRNRVSYRANTQHPLFGSLQDIVHKCLGLDRIVETVLQRMGEVDQVVLTGDYAEGRDSGTRSDEHTSELQSLMRISYAVFCLKKKKIQFMNSE